MKNSISAATFSAVYLVGGAGCGRGGGVGSAMHHKTESHHELHRYVCMYVLCSTLAHHKFVHIYP